MSSWWSLQTPHVQDPLFMGNPLWNSPYCLLHCIRLWIPATVMPLLTGRQNFFIGTLLWANPSWAVYSQQGFDPLRSVCKIRAWQISWEKFLLLFDMVDFYVPTVSVKVASEKVFTRVVPHDYFLGIPSLWSIKLFHWITPLLNLSVTATVESPAWQIPRRNPE